MYVCAGCKTDYPTQVAVCWVCLSAGLVVIKPTRAHAEAFGVFRASTAAELVKSHWSLVTPKAYPELRLLRGALVLLYGGPGQGKSTMLCRLLDTLERPVVLVAAEERFGPAVAERLSRLGIHRESFHVVGQGSVDEIAAFCLKVKAEALGVDSVSAAGLTSAELRSLGAAARVGLLVGTLQATKTGAPLGANELLHEADVTAHVEALRWSLEKSRYQALPVTGAV